MANIKANSEMLKKETVGVEIEGYGMTQREVADAIQELFNEKGANSTAFYEGRHLRNFVAIDHKGRKWNVVSDASLSSSDGTFEMVTPILHYEDIELLQEVVRRLREKGARSDNRHGCGVHIHVGIKNDENPATPKSIRSLANIVKNHEKLIVKSIKMSRSRYEHGYARSINPQLIEALNTKKPKTWESLKKVHYDTLGHDFSHYSSTRYYFLNLHAIWDKGTVEFRCFEFQGNLHAGWLKAWIQLCMALVSYSKLVGYARPHEVYDENEKFCMKNWLNNLGLIGDEFKTCRVLFLRRLEGDASQKTPAHRVDTLDDLTLDD